MLLARLALLLLFYGECAANNVTIFFTDQPYAPILGLTPDDICRMEGSNASAVARYPLILGNRNYQAVFVMAGRRDLKAIFSNATAIINLHGEVLALNATALFANTSLPIYTPLGDSSNHTNVSYWTGVLKGDNSGTGMALNCADFTRTSASGHTSVWGFSLGEAYPHNCNQYVFLCAVADMFPLPEPPVTTPNTVYLFATSSTTQGRIDDPDQVCYTESRDNVKLSGFNRSQFQALVFTAYRQSLHPMFADVGSGSIQDLDGNIIAPDSIQLFQGDISRASLRCAPNNTAKLGLADPFWTGAGNTNGSQAGENCADFSTTSGRGWYGTLDSSVHSTQMGCTYSYPFICAANVVPLNVAQFPTEGKFAYLYFSNDQFQGNFLTVNDPSENCRADISNYQGVPNATIINISALGLFSSSSSSFISFFDDDVIDIRDIHNNIIATNVSQMVQPIYMALAGLQNVTRSIDQQFWTGAGSADGRMRAAANLTCSNWTSNSGSEYGSVGTLAKGVNASSANCSAFLPFLCAIIVYFGTVPTLAPTTALPTTVPTTVPTTSPTTIAPTTAVPTTTPTTAVPTSVPGSVTTNFTGTGAIIIVAGNQSIVNVSFPSDPVLGTNGTVKVNLTEARNGSVSSVISVIFIADGGVQNVTNLSNPIVITFPILLDAIGSFLDSVTICEGSRPTRGSKVRPQCSYWNETSRTWETNGCTTSPLNSSMIQCSCTHFTDFAILPKHNLLVPTEFLALTPANVQEHPAGVISIVILLSAFVIIFSFAARRDWKEAKNYEKLKADKLAKRQRDRLKKRRIWKQIKIDFQKRHTWSSLIFRKSGTSFLSVDRTFVALFTIFTSMTMSAFFHAQDNDDLINRGVIFLLTICACFIPSQILVQLFVHTGPMGFFEEMELEHSRQKSRCRERFSQYRFPAWCRHMWRLMTFLAVAFMIAYILTMSMQFDRQPFFFCQGAPAFAWVTTWLGAYAIMAFGIETLRILLLALMTFYCADLAAELSQTAIEMGSTDTAGTCAVETTDKPNNKELSETTDKILG